MFLARKWEKGLMNRREAKVSGIEGREKGELRLLPITKVPARPCPGSPCREGNLYRG
jgi:hypothetical protein